MNAHEESAPEVGLGWRGARSEGYERRRIMPARGCLGNSDDQWRRNDDGNRLGKSHGKVDRRPAVARYPIEHSCV